MKMSEQFFVKLSLEDLFKDNVKYLIWSGIPIRYKGDWIGQGKWSLWKSRLVNFWFSFLMLIITFVLSAQIYFMIFNAGRVNEYTGCMQGVLNSVGYIMKSLLMVHTGREFGNLIRLIISIAKSKKI